jgi:ferredoxin
MTRVTVDGSRCEGHGLCQATAPDVFEVDDDDGIARVRHDPVPTTLMSQAEAGVRVCPVAALTLSTS